MMADRDRRATRAELERKKAKLAELKKEKEERLRKATEKNSQLQSLVRFLTNCYHFRIMVEFGDDRNLKLQNCMS